MAGRTPGVHLNEKGLAEADALANALQSWPIRAIYASPLERAQETAAPLAAKLGLTVSIAPEIVEVDFGDWNGWSFEDLEADSRWQRFNAFRSGTRAPSGETMADVLSRMASFLPYLEHTHPDEEIALFSHGDPIKLALATYLGTPIDLMARIEISTASVSTIQLSAYGPRIARINHRFHGSRFTEAGKQE